MPETAETLIPERATLPRLRDAASRCTACHLHKGATQTVFGEGTRRAQVMLVGEQPGDREDIEGQPFVGPAGKLLDRALEEAGVSRGDVYLTNVVKHFKYEQRGKRRIHQRPNAEEIGACRPWLEAEVALVKPKVLVCLGATAAKTLLGQSFRVTKQRRELIESELAPFATATVHPSSILRAPNDDARHRAYADFVQDLRVIAEVLD